MTYCAAASALGVVPCVLRKLPNGTNVSCTGVLPQSRSACRPTQLGDFVFFVKETPPGLTFHPASAHARPSGSSSPPTTSFVKGIPRPCRLNFRPYGSNKRSPIHFACGTAVADAMSIMRTMSNASCAVMGRDSSSLLSPFWSACLLIETLFGCSASLCSEPSRATDSFAERSRRARSPSISVGVRIPPFVVSVLHSPDSILCSFASHSIATASSFFSAASDTGVLSDGDPALPSASLSFSGVCARDARAHGSVHSSGNPIKRSTSRAESIPAAARPFLQSSSRTTHNRRAFLGVKDSSSCNTGGRRFSVKSTHAATEAGSALPRSLWKHS